MLGSVSGAGVVRIGAGATLVLAAAGGPSTVGVAFAGAHGTLAVQTTTYFDGAGIASGLTEQGVISGFGGGDAIRYGDAAVTSVSYASAGDGFGTLTLMSGGTVAGTLTLAGIYDGGTFRVVPNGLSGSDIVLAVPEAPVVSSVGGLTNRAAQTVVGTGAEAGSTVSVLDGATVLGVGTAGVDGTWSVGVVLGGDGLHVLSATDTDAAGNRGQASAPVGFVLDTTPPAALMVAAAGGLTNQAAQTLAGASAEAGSVVSVLEGATVLGTGVAGVDGRWSVGVGLAGDGVHVLAAVDTDAAGNTGQASAPVGYLLDTTPPLAPLVVSAGGLTNRAGQTVAGAGAEAGSVVSVLEGTAVLGTGVAGVDGTWSVGVSLGGDGVHVLVAIDTDAAGNTGQTSAPVGFVLDTMPPVAPMVISVGELTNQGGQTVAGAGAEAGSIVSVLEGASVLGRSVAGADGTWRVGVALGGDGVHVLAAIDTDAAGNAGQTSAPIGFVLDTTPPAAPMVASAGGLTNRAAQILAGAGAEAGSIVSVLDGAAVLGRSVAGGDGSWNVGVSLIGDGVHVLSVTDTDAAGNTGPVSVPVGFVLDATPPAAPVVVSAGGLTNQGGQTVAGAGAEAGSIVSVLEGATVLGRSVAGADGTWRVGVALGGDGVHVLDAIDTDAAGNTGQASVAVGYVLDTTPPAALVVGSAGGLTNRTVQILAGAGAEAGSVVSVLEGATVLGRSTAGSDGTWSVGVALGGDGVHVLDAVDTDAAGNTGQASAAVGYVLDTIPPAAPVVGSAGGLTNQAAQIVAGAGAEAGNVVSVLEGATVLGTGVAGVDGRWSVGVALGGDGIHVLAAIDTDAAGNGGQASAPVAFILDTVAPAVAITSGGGVVHAARVDIVGTGEAGTAVAVRDGSTVLGTATVGAGGVWTTGITLSGGGAHTLVATDTDAAGNTGTSAAVAFTVVPVVSPPSGDPLFDAAYYLAHNPDVAAAGVDPYAHYIQNGWREGRDPSALFSTGYYLHQNPDVAAAGINPLLHYETSGWREGRDPSVLFSTGTYLGRYPDVAAAGVDPLLHYVTSGQAEGRTATAATPHALGTPDLLVDAAYVYAHHPEVAAAGLDATAWFHSAGWQAGANPDAFFDIGYYLRQNPDVAAAGVDPLLHFETDGWREGRSPSLLFSDAKYLAANPDVAAAGIDPLLHYVADGQAEGRVAFLPGNGAAADPLVDAAFYDRQLGATLVPAGPRARRRQRTAMRTVVGSGGLARMRCSIPLTTSGRTRTWRQLG